MEKKVEWGEGLIGACALEKEPVYITDLPRDYITITSGLGDVTPDCLLLEMKATQEEADREIQRLKREIAKNNSRLVEKELKKEGKYYISQS